GAGGEMRRRYEMHLVAARHQRRAQRHHRIHVSAASQRDDDDSPWRGHRIHAAPFLACAAGATDSISRQVAVTESLWARRCAMTRHCAATWGEVRSADSFFAAATTE